MGGGGGDTEFGGRGGWGNSSKGREIWPGRARAGNEAIELGGIVAALVANSALSYEDASFFPATEGFGRDAEMLCRIFDGEFMLGEEVGQSHKSWTWVCMSMFVLTNITVQTIDIVKV